MAKIKCCGINFNIFQSMGREKHVDTAADIFRSLMRKSTRKKPRQERFKTDNLVPGLEETEDEDEEDGEEEGEAEEEEDVEEEEKKKDEKKSSKVQNMSTSKIVLNRGPNEILSCTWGCPCLSVFNLCSSPWQSVFEWVSMNPYISLVETTCSGMRKLLGVLSTKMGKLQEMGER